MANLNRILGMASKVIDKQLHKRSAGNGSLPQRTGQPGGTDWRNVVRTAADRITGDDRGGRQPQTQRPAGGVPAQHQDRQHVRGPVGQDAVALAKYDYLLRTASPDQLEQAHHDAFARLTPQQRQQVLTRMNTELPPHERAKDDSAGGLARTITRGEVARPGLVRRVLGSGGPSGGRGRAGAVAGGAAVGAGAVALGGIAAAVAGGAVVSAAAAPVLAGAADLGVDFEGIAAGFGAEGLGDLALGVEGIAGQGGDVISGLGDHVSGLGDQASGLGEQASGLGERFLGELFDR
jgi:hypothetical protein